MRRLPPAWAYNNKDSYGVFCLGISLDARSLRRHLLSSAALVTALSAYGRRVYAACVPSGGSSFQCSGANATTQTINVNDATVSTLPGFSVMTAAGDGITITGDGALSYTDTNASPITAASTALYIQSNGDVPAGNLGSITINTDGALRGAFGIEALNYGSGAVSITANGDVTGTGFAGIRAFNNYGTDLTVTTGAGTTITGGFFGLLGINFGTGVLTLTVHGDVTGSTALAATNYGTNLIVTTGAGTTVAGGDIGIAATNYGSGNLDITVNGDITGTLTSGIDTFNFGTKLTVTTGVGTTVSGGQYGIRALNYGSGTLTISANGDVTGISKDGILAASYNNSPIDITVGPGATIVGGDAGVQFTGGGTNSLKNFGTIENLNGIAGAAILGSGGDETVDNYGIVTGTVTLSGVTNAFNNRAGGLFNSGATATLGAGNALTNDGVLSPGGNSIVLTTTLNGDFAQTGAGRFAVNLQGASSDLLDVTGSASLDGHVQPLFTLSGLGSATQWKILTSGVPILDNGIAVDNTAAVTFGLVFPTLTEMDLVLLSVNFAAQGLNRNEMSIAENLNAIYGAGGGSLVSLLDALAGLPTLGGLANALDQLSPEVYLDTEIATLFSQLAFTNAMMSCPTREGADAFIKEGQCVWARVSGRDLNQDSTFQTLGFDETSFEVAGGAQFALDSAWRLGFALGYEHSNLATDTNAKSDGGRFDGGVVVKYNPGSLLLAAAVSGGSGTYDFDRPINFPGFSALARANSDIGTIDARLRAAYLLTGGAWYVKPLVDFDATWLMLGSTIEQGAGGASLNVGGNNETVLSVSPALEVGTQFKWTAGTLLRPYLRGGATFFGNNNFALLANFEGAPAAVGPFQITTKTNDVVADVGAGLDWIGPAGTELKLLYEGRLGDLVSEQSGGLKASVPF
jgi:Autotransporter beta-domain